MSNCDTLVTTKTNLKYVSVGAAPFSVQNVKNCALLLVIMHVTINSSSERIDQPRYCSEVARSYEDSNNSSSVNIVAPSYP